MEKIKIESSDIFEYIFPHDISCSPDGKHIAYIISNINEEKDCYEHDLYVMDIKTEKQIHMTQTKDVTSFSWISNTELLFTSKRNKPKAGTTDFYTISIEGGEAKEAFSIPKACSVPVSLGNKLWLLTTKNPTDSKKSEPDRAVEGVDYWTFTDKPFIRDRENFSQRRRVTLELYQEGENITKAITPKFCEVAGIDVSSDKNRILYTGQIYEDCATPFSGLWEYHIDSGETKELVPQGKYQISLAKYIGKDKVMLQASTLERSITQNHDIFILDLSTSEINMIASPDGMYATLLDVDAVYGGGRSNKVIGDKFIGARICRTMTEFNEFDTKTGNIRIITKVDAFTSFDIYDNTMYTVMLKDYELAEIYSIDMTTGTMKKMTAFSKPYLDTHKVSLPEKLTFVAKNKEEVDGFVIPPIDAKEGEKYPAVLFIHGGPKWAYGYMFTHLKQCVTSKGMYVIYCNPHGGDGYGEKFLEMVERWGYVDYEHLMEFVDTCIEKYPGIDADRLGVAGGSYGGYMTNWIIGHTDRFKAAVSQRGISNLITASLIIDFGDRIMKQTCGDKTPWNHEEVLWNHSPIKYVKNVKTPTLFLHSDRDYRCFMGDTFQMFTALKQLGVDTEMYLFHGDTHGLSRNGRPSNRIARANAIVDWFERYL
ncbi:peptidase, S9 family [Clostridioides difficile]|uniref:Peptidase n=3 Tax=Clostridioides difficile TaxID=1496 RepID=A0A9R0BIE3_CLODR|nr:S9 family peptidase [Clostridioides difficile]OFU01077.1 peptidase S9 [Clostridium sp. HMSC19E03]OFU19471.1 peptidase S9 [Clostridium sp. HMSC19C08]OFU20181.1 peptidase S9 [Clostridium sp. HMSC19C09]OFU20762.1 peptidase S9 [Clostridium sp. HMSC19C05]OFU33007.1 peptidase S9 [Clostridium sp. HMSC19B10]OFU41705.1 peptidase S9 [Clostridium sp. HMSC19B01]